MILLSDHDYYSHFIFWIRKEKKVWAKLIGLEQLLICYSIIIFYELYLYFVDLISGFLIFLLETYLIKVLTLLPYRVSSCISRYKLLNCNIIVVAFCEWTLSKMCDKHEVFNVILLHDKQFYLNENSL